MIRDVDFAMLHWLTLPISFSVWYCLSIPVCLRIGVGIGNELQLLHLLNIGKLIYTDSLDSSSGSNDGSCLFKLIINC